MGNLFQLMYTKTNSTIDNIPLLFAINTNYIKLKMQSQIQQ
jgi:hypothetical protein